jgi:hypothetical protein
MTGCDIGGTCTTNGKMRKSYNNLSKENCGTNHSGDQGIDGWLLKRILEHMAHERV